jgi:hypothetical protein
MGPLATIEASHCDLGPFAHSPSCARPQTVPQSPGSPFHGLQPCEVCKIRIPLIPSVPSGCPRAQRQSPVFRLTGQINRVDPFKLEGRAPSSSAYRPGRVRTDLIGQIKWSARQASVLQHATSRSKSSMPFALAASRVGHAHPISARVLKVTDSKSSSSSGAHPISASGLGSCA